MTPGSSVGFGLGDQQFALDPRDHGTGHDGPARPGPVARHAAGPVNPACPLQGAARTPSLLLVRASARKGRQ